MGADAVNSIRPMAQKVWSPQPVREPSVFSDSEQRVNRLLRCVAASPELQQAVRKARTMSELLALFRSCSCPLEKIDVLLSYRDWNESFWPWFGRSKQDRRFFVHESYLPSA